MTDEPRRPILLAGERLSERSEHSRGGGEKYHPFTYGQAHERLSGLAHELLAREAQLPQALGASHLVVEARLLPNYLADSHYPAGLLDRIGLYPVGSRPDTADLHQKAGITPDKPTKTVLLAGSRESVRELGEVIASPPPQAVDTLWDDIRKLDSIALPDPERVVRGIDRLPDQNGMNTWEAVLHPLGRDRDERAVLTEEAWGRLLTLVEASGGEVRANYRRSVNGLTFVPLRLTLAGARSVARFNVMRALRPLAKIRPFPESSLRIDSGRLSPPEPGALPSSDERVAVFDGGINSASAFIGPYVRCIDVTKEPPAAACLRHGHMVTSALLFGHVDHPAEPLPVPFGYVDHYRVLPVGAQHDDDDCYWILDRVREVLRRKAYRLVVLSIGPDYSVGEDDAPDRWTTELDALAKELGVVVVVAAGNNGSQDAARGYNRVQLPADMVNGLSVGATPHRDPKSKLVRAEYSPVGPGRNGQRVQPVGIAFGGDPGGEMFAAIDHRDRLAATAGTSFAAPLAARGILQLLRDLGPRSRPEMLRAFAVHFQHSAPPRLRSSVGFGRFRETYDAVWECEDNECTVIYTDRLARAALTAFNLPFPVALPAGIAVRLDWTLAFLTDVAPSDLAEYTTTGFELAVRPDADLVTLYNSTTKEPIGPVRLGSAEFRRHAAAGPVHWGQPKSKQWTNRRPTYEGDLREASKWETIVRGSTKLTAGETFRPRIDLNHLAREQGRLVSNVDAVDVCMIVSMKAPEGVALYDAVRGDYPVLVPFVRVPITVPTTG